MRIAIFLYFSIVLSVGQSFQTPCSLVVARHGGGVATATTTFASNRNNHLVQPHPVATPSHKGKTSSSLLATVSTSNDIGEEWTKPRLHNALWFRSAAILLTIGIVGVPPQSPVNNLPARALALIHLLSYSTWFGTLFYTTFIAGFTMFNTLPRQVFGRLQSKLFPKYFALSSITILLQIITLKRLPLNSAYPSTAIKALSVALASTVLNQFYLEPITTSQMLERYELENKDGGMETDRYKTLRAGFGKLHGLSSFTNLIAIIGAVVHGYVLSTLLLI